MKIRKPKVRLEQEHVELVGFVALVAAATLLGLWCSGPLLAAVLGLFLAGVLLVLAGNA